MRNLKPFIDALAAKTMYAPAGWEDRAVKTVFASDLVSDILVAEGDKILLLTSLMSDQALHIAEVMDASAVILVNRSHIPAMLGKAAAKHGMPLFYTSIPKFECCVRLGRLLEEGEK